MSGGSSALLRRRAAEMGVVYVGRTTPQWLINRPVLIGSHRQGRHAGNSGEFWNAEKVSANLAVVRIVSRVVDMSRRFVVRGLAHRGLAVQVVPKQQMPRPHQRGG